MNLLALQDSGDRSWLIWLAILVFPMLARLAKAVLARFGIETEAKGGKRAPARPRGRTQRKPAEAEGEELWRRLLRGEVEPPEPRPSPRAAPEPSPQPEPALEPRPTVEPRRELVSLARLPSDSSQEGSARLPTLASFVTDLSPDGPVRIEGTTLRRLAAEPTARVRRRFFGGARDLRRAIILSEVLGPPVSQRGLDRNLWA